MLENFRAMLHMRYATPNASLGRRVVSWYILYKPTQLRTPLLVHGSPYSAVGRLAYHSRPLSFNGR